MESYTSAAEMQDAARRAGVGMNLRDLTTPAVILDRAVVARNCRQMLAMCEKVGVAFRGHIKTHKTVEATELMMGGPDSTRDIKLVVSTELELRHIQSWLQNQKQKGRGINVLYGIPLPVSRTKGLKSFSDSLGDDALSVMIDHPAQIDALQGTGLNPQAFIKIDTGYHRAGVPHSSQSTSLRTLLKRMREAQVAGDVTFQGFYSHGGDAYGVSSFQQALDILGRELRGLQEASTIAKEEGVDTGKAEGYTLSVGATPTISVAWMNADPAAQNGEVPAVIKQLQGDGHTVEFHAGNYPILDIQQIATAAGASSIAAVPSADHCPPRTVSDLAMTVLAEVNSSYTSGEREFPEQLITAGCLALGREPCKSYDGWGVISAWPYGKTGEHGGIQRGSGWYVHSISQEHGRIKQGNVPGVPGPGDMVAGEAEGASSNGHQPLKWQVGNKLRVWPNHACITASNYPYFYIVDGTDESKGEKVVDLWARCVGW